MKAVAPNLIVTKKELLLDLFFSQACNFLKVIFKNIFVGNYTFFLHYPCHKLKMVFKH